MGKDFIKFMVLVVVIYCGFLTTFSLLGREHLSLHDMVMSLTKIFFGSSFVGFDLIPKMDTLLGPPLMIIFITLSSILLTGSLTGMLSNSFSRVITHAREEYLYVYSVYVLEASTSNRLTHFYPPFNLLAVLIFRPLRLFLPSDNKFRAARILLLKATHLPIVAVIEFYEWLTIGSSKGTQYSGFRGPRQAVIGSPHPAAAKRFAQARLSNNSLRADNNNHLSQLRPPAITAISEGAIAGRRAQQQAADEAVEGRAFGQHEGDVEARIADLTAKIDRLTELVLTLQTQSSTTLGNVGVA